MWLSLSKGFLSVVVTKQDPNMVMVRARRKEHLESYFSTHNIVVTKSADYPFRVICSKAALTAVLVRYIDSMDYGNFKNSVKDQKLHDAYMDTWTRMTKLEEVPHWQRQQEGWAVNHLAQATAPKPVHNPVHSGGKPDDDPVANKSFTAGPFRKFGLDHKTKRRKWCPACDSYVTSHEQEMVCTAFDCPAHVR
jgi:hypothetical protein